MTGVFTFIGVSTGSSAIQQIYPRWAAELGLDARLVGVDLPLDAPPADYRAAVEQIRDDPNGLGGLITTHKLNVLAATRDLFHELNDSARLLHEVSCISKRDGQLHGAALDDQTSMLALNRIRDPHDWADSELLLLGAGGASVATTLGLHHAPGAPARIHVTARSSHRLDEMRKLHGEIGFSIPISYHVTESAEAADRLVAGLAPRSVVVNATGMGKDRPGSPLTDRVRFPEDAIAWDMNYRGERRFLQQAAQSGVEVVDGWDYFVYSWTRVVAVVHGIDIPASGPLFDKLSAIARDSA